MLVTFANLFFSGNVLAQDLSEIWQQIDDETGSPKAIIEIQINNSVTRRFINPPSQAIPPQENASISFLTLTSQL